MEKIFSNGIFGNVSSLGDFVVENNKDVASIKTLIYTHFKNFNKNFQSVQKPSNKEF